MTQKIIENEESNNFVGLFQQTVRSLTPFNLNSEAIPLPTLQNVCSDLSVLSEILSGELEYPQEVATNWKDLLSRFYRTTPYQMSLPLEIPCGQQNTTVLQLLKPYMMQNTATVKKD